MDGTITWTDTLPDEVIQLMVEQIHGEYYEAYVYNTEECTNNLDMHYTEFDHRTVWTWDEEDDEQ